MGRGAPPAHVARSAGQRTPDRSQRRRMDGRSPRRDRPMQPVARPREPDARVKPIWRRVGSDDAPTPKFDRSPPELETDADRSSSCITSDSNCSQKNDLEIHTILKKVEELGQNSSRWADEVDDDMDW